MHINIKSACIGAFAGLTNGLFGSGGGTIVVPAMERFLGIEAHIAHASAIAVILPLSAASAALYTGGLSADWLSLLFVSIGGVIGGLIGAHLLGKVSARWLHKAFGLFMAAAAVRMIL